MFVNHRRRRAIEAADAALEARIREANRLATPRLSEVLDVALAELDQELRPARRETLNSIVVSLGILRDFRTDISPDVVKEYLATIHRARQ
jgi:hypothetical protein